MLFGNKLRQWVDSTLTTNEFADYFESLQGRIDELAAFENAQALLDALKPERGTFQEKDGILAALIAEHQASPTSDLNVLFLAMFRPLLARLFGRLIRGTSDADGLWNDLTWALLSELSEYPLDRRPVRVAANVGGGVLKRLSRWKVREDWYVLFQSDSTEPSRTEYNYDALLGGSFEHPNEIFAGKGSDDEPPTEDAIARMENVLRAFLRNGTITEDAFYLLLATRVYGRSMKEFACENSRSHAAVRAQRSRAEKAIRKAVCDKSEGLDVTLSDLIGVLWMRGESAPSGGRNEDESE